jgi:hypothetical protein
MKIKHFELNKGEGTTSSHISLHSSLTLLDTNVSKLQQEISLGMNSSCAISLQNLSQPTAGGQQQRYRFQIAHE